jgi:translation initiation factor IF-3
MVISTLVKPHRVNGEIRRNTPEVRVVSDEGEQLGVLKIDEALRIAEEQETDLVEISPNADPPVCRLVDYGKFKYREQKRLHEAKVKQKIVHLKEIKLRPATDDHDYQVKLRSILKFLEEGDRVKVTLRFRGREMAHQELGMRQLERVQADLTEHAVIETPARLEGRQAIMILGPKKKK